jgi:hypothetical protein
MSKDQALFDLGYEWRMYRKLHRLLSVLPTDEDPVRDALTESLLLHARNLIETFWGSKEGKKARDAVGITLEKMPEDIGRLYGRLSTCIVHLPDDRPATKQAWDFHVIGPALEAKIEALRNAKVIPHAWEGDRDPDTKLLCGGDPTVPDKGGALTTPIAPTGMSMPLASASNVGSAFGVVGPKP